MLPISLQLVYALNAATFQISGLALLSIVNTRVGIPAEYLPAYGAISFLPYSLRPIFAWFSTLLLNRSSSSSSSSARTTNENSNRHDKLLFPAFLLSCFAFVGTTFIPDEGTVLCFIWGVSRGIAGAWSDFLVGMSVIEFSKVQVGFTQFNDGDSTSSTTYEQIVSINTAQSSKARNIGSFVASIATFLFFTKNSTLCENAVNTLLFGTAGVFFLASLASLKYQFHVEKSLADHNGRYDTVDDNDEEHVVDSTSSFQQSSPLPSGRDELEPDGLNRSEGILSSAVLTANDDLSEPSSMYRQQIMKVSTLVAFQALLAVSALQKPIIAVSNKNVWVALVVTLGMILIFTISLGYWFEKQQKQSAAPLTSASSRSGPSSDKEESHRLPHGQLNLYFLLRYSMPIAGFLMYSYLYAVFQSEPQFLQLLSVLKSATGSVAILCYEKFLAPHCHSGWPLIGLIACLDILMGFIALLDVWVIRLVKEKEVDGAYTIDSSLRCLVVVVGLVKYFFAELDYMPALVLSSTNIYSDDDKRFDCGGDGRNNLPQDSDDVGNVNTSLSNDFESPRVASLSIDSYNNEVDDNTTTPPKNPSAAVPMFSAGMQYASFLSCIDFGAQIGDWITVPIIASLGITRDNHWDHLDQLVVICSIFRMVRVVFLWLICPPIRTLSERS